ncbi:bactoprenol glucosyl transferase [Loigolactobacillus backii]|uniref:Bactoprenol glucosyl transferase n=1 Tax=Loigolactobacillus backii TaxID=375175 RepID=A0A192H2V1_9LACO|nr:MULTISPECIES: glycosyltransferase family 2 protein [Loigolactobacillus]ANK62557.1 bactoprenol glucosyl transferase [Loigolactobacillus backii]ANK70432.1 bactoprenol glucosyl transferase [Loigolactobacillus backii]
MKKISLIVPCFNEQETIPLFYPTLEKIKPQLRGYELEYWFINDGSKDDTLIELQKLQSQDPNQVHFISFSRNFGKEAALYAGLKAVNGDYVAVMDVDLQDPPDQLPEMLAGIEDEGYDIVGTRRKNRQGEPKIRSFFSDLFYKVINKISSTEILNGVRDYRLMTRQVVNAILEMSEYNRFSKGIFSWVGFDTKYLEYENRDRSAGNTSWSFWKLFRYSIEGIVDFSDAPLSIASFIGLFSFVIAAIALIFIVIRQLIVGGSVAGWASLVSIVLMIGGLQLLCLGIVGRYIGNIYLETKKRPIYIIKEKK